MIPDSVLDFWENYLSWYNIVDVTDLRALIIWVEVNRQSSGIHGCITFNGLTFKFWDKFLNRFYGECNWAPSLDFVLFKSFNVRHV